MDNDRLAGDAMADLTLTFLDLYKEVSNFLGLGLSPAGDSLALAKKCANDGYRLFLMGMDPRSGRAYAWTFLSPEHSLTLSAGAADGHYALPADFAAILDDPTLPSESTGHGARPSRLAPRSAAYIRQLHAGGAPGGPPRYYAVMPQAFDAAVGQRYDLLVWPTPAAGCSLRFRYRVEPAALAADADRPLGGPQHALTILEAALAVAEQRHNDTRGIHTEQFERLMAFSIDLDAANQPRALGDVGGGAPEAFERRGIVTYPEAD